MRYAIGLFLLLSGSVWAGELEDAKQELVDMQSRLEFIRLNGLHDQDLGRILKLQKTTGAVQRSIDENKLMSMATFNAYKQQDVQYRYSILFFEFIRTNRTEQAIKELLTLVTKIRQKLQLDEDPFNKILASNFKQLRDSMEGLKKLAETPASLLAEFPKILVLIGTAESLSLGEGDRPKAFKAARQAYWPLFHLYPQFQSITSKDGNALVLEILGLNEFIGEYAQAKEYPEGE